MNFPQLKREKKIAQKLIKKYSLSPPVDVVSLIKNYANIVEDSLPSGVDAICIMNENKSTVFIDKFQPPNRQRFTMAHELGHLVLPWHFGMISCNTNITEDIDENAYSRMENEANNFAAEILMPTNWLRNLIFEKESINLYKLIVEVSETAHVSKEAALYNIINNLPKENIIFVLNSNNGFRKLFFTKEYDLFIPYTAYYEFSWLTDICQRMQTYRFDNLEIVHWQLYNDIPEKHYETIFNEIENFQLTNALNSLINYNKSSFTWGIKKFISLLPPSYVIFIYSDNYQRIYYSNGTNIRVPLSDSINFIKSNSSFMGEVQIFDYTILWGYFLITRPSIITNPNDNRKSTDILKIILSENVYNDSEREHLMRSFNGVIGALNNKAPREYNEFYRMLKEKLIGNQKYSPITNHSLFELYISKRINELINK